MCALHEGRCVVYLSARRKMHARFAELHRDRHEAGLGTVVEVALDAPKSRVRVGESRGATGAQGRDSFA
jgi:hypothetical protein